MASGITVYSESGTIQFDDKRANWLLKRSSSSGLPYDIARSSRSLLARSNVGDFLFEPADLFTPSSHGWGIEVMDSAGKLTYSTAYPPLQIVSVIPNWQAVTPVTVPAGKTYAIVSWYLTDGFQATIVNMFSYAMSRLDYFNQEPVYNSTARTWSLGEQWTYGDWVYHSHITEPEYGDYWLPELPSEVGVVSQPIYMILDVTNYPTNFSA